MLLVVSVQIPKRVRCFFFFFDHCRLNQHPKISLLKVWSNIISIMQNLVKNVGPEL